MTLGSPTHAIIGASDATAMAEYLARFGFTVRRTATLPAAAAEALYGLDAETREIELAAPGAAVGWLRVVETHLPAIAPLPYGHGPALIDLYTRDIAVSMAEALAGGAHPGPTVGYPVEGLGSVYEARALGPDHLPLGFVMSDSRRSSLLDRDPGAMHSELHAYVWTVPSIDETVPFWRDEAGMTQLLDSLVDDPGISQFMELPRPGVSIRIVHLSDVEANPVRFELMEFPDDRGAQRPTLPLRPGLYAAAFQVGDLVAAQGAMSGAVYRPVVRLDTALHQRAVAVSGLAPGGVRFELWQEERHGH
ncbi:MAG: hypothetical protein ACLQBX_02050 [Candidatus Limnocylindrales bacterium]